jgi:hypothetical protein
MRSRVPVPPQVPLVKFFSPEKSDNGLIEFWSSEVASYQPLDLGAVHPNTRDFAGYKLVKQQNLPNDQRFVVRIWARDDTNPQWFNYALKFVSESSAHPIFIRTFRELRNTYTPRTKGQPLKAVYKLSLTNAGSGYTPGTLPALTFSNGGTGGTGAAGHAVAAPDQTIAELVLDESGSGYNTAPTFTIEAPPSGTTATGTAVIQPATAVLVAEEAQEFPDDSEFNGLYLNVVRVYQTLPGPLLSGQDYNRQFSVPIPFTEQETLAGVGIGDDLKEIEPITSVKSKTRTVDPTLLQAVFDNYILLFADVADIPLPDVLTSISSVKNSSQENGASVVDDAYGSTTGDHGSYSVSVPVSNQSAAAVSFELNFIITQGRERGRNKHTQRGVVLMPEGFTSADLDTHITALTGITVSTWPDFRPQMESFVVKGMSVGVRTEAQVQGHVSFDTTAESDAASATHSYSKRIGINSGPVRVSPTIHGALSIGGDGTSDSKTATSSSHASLTGDITESADSGSITATAVAAISPTSLSATPGQATYPTSGFRRISQNAEPFMYRYIMVHFELFDFGSL